MAKILFIALSTLGLSLAKGEIAQNYQDSECYKEYTEIYQKGFKRSIDRLRSQREMAARYGITSNSGGGSDEGKMEKSLINAADLTPKYNGGYTPRYTLNDFDFIHHKVLKKFPNADPFETRHWIREGFRTGAFCSKFLFFKYRYGKKKAAKHVIRRFESSRRDESSRAAEVSDSELTKEEGLGADNDVEASSSKAPSSKVKTN